MEKPKLTIAIQSRSAISTCRTIKHWQKSSCPKGSRCHRRPNWSLTDLRCTHHYRCSTISSHGVVHSLSCHSTVTKFFTDYHLCAGIRAGLKTVLFFKKQTKTRVFCFKPGFFKAWEFLRHWPKNPSFPQLIDQKFLHFLLSLTKLKKPCFFHFQRMFKTLF